MGLLEWLGIEVEEYVSFDEIMGRHAETVGTIREYVADEDAFGRHYRPLIERLARYVYTLPASEAHHHRGEGGLFEHSIQAAMNGMRAFDAHPIRVRDGFGYTVISETHREMPRWKLALFVALLLHDVGKVFTMTVRAAGQEWDPLTRPLYDFLRRDAGTFSYEVEWARGRGRTHEKFTPLVFPLLVGREERRFLGLHLCAMVVDAITPMPQQDNWMRAFVAQADQQSVSEDAGEGHAVAAAFIPAAPPSGGAGGGDAPAFEPPGATGGFRAPGRGVPKGVFGDAPEPPPPHVKKRERTEAGSEEEREEKEKVGAAPVSPDEPTGGDRDVGVPQEGDGGMDARAARSAQEEKEGACADEGGSADPDRVDVSALAAAMRGLVEEGRMAVNEITRTKPFLLLIRSMGLVQVWALREVLRRFTGRVVSPAELPRWMERLHAAGVVGRVDGEAWFARVRSEQDGKSRRHEVAVLSRAFVLEAVGREDGYPHRLRDVPERVDFAQPERPPERGASRKTSATQEHADEARALVARFVGMVLEKAGERPQVYLPQQNAKEWFRAQGAPTDLVAVCMKVMRKERITEPAPDRSKDGRPVIRFSVARAREWLEGSG